MSEAELKKAIKMSNDLGESYVVKVDKYVNVLDYMNHIDASEYRVDQLKNKQDVLKDVYDVVFYNGNKIVEKRKAVVKDGGLCVARNVKKGKHSLIYNFFFNLKLFSFM